MGADQRRERRRRRRGLTTPVLDIDRLRHAVLRSWTESPTRFREDANAEEDFLLHGYADRLLVELAQNAADAASRQGMPGRLAIWLESGVLHAANTGAPLDEAGIAALASLRASAKRDGHSAGRFGVGFVAVLAVTDEPEVRSANGGVRFSASWTRAAAVDVPHLAEEVVRRDGRVPVLRLPWPSAEPPADGFATEVVLPLREGAEQAVRAALVELDPALLLALPGLAVVEVGDRRIERTAADPSIPGDVLITVDEVATRWRVIGKEGVPDPHLVADRPVEEQHRGGWSLLWAVPVDDDGAARLLDLPQFVHAPTISDEPLSVPARLIGTFPLTADRRRIPASRFTDWLADTAGELLADLVADLAPTDRSVRLVPTPNLAGARLDSRIGAAGLAALRRARWLRAADPSDPALAPDHAVRLPAALAEASDLLAGSQPGLLHRLYAQLPGATRRAVERDLDRLGVRVLTVADVVAAASAAADRSPAWWGRLYAVLRQGLAADPTMDLDALGSLPVPLADGRTITGPGRVLLPAEGAGPAIDRLSTVLGLPVVHPDAADPLLGRLGALPVTAATLLQDVRIRSAVEHSLDLAEDDPAAADELAEAVLGLLRLIVDVGDLGAGAGATGPGWLGELALPAEGGGYYPAAELVLPGSPLDRVLTAGPEVPRLRSDLLDQYPPEVLIAAGVPNRFTVHDEPDVDLADLPDLPEVEIWAEFVREGVAATLPAGPLLVDRLVTAVDLDLVRADAWTEALRLLGDLPGLRPECQVRAVDGSAAPVPAYLTWWLSHRPVLGGARPADLRTAGAAALAGVFDPPPVQVPDRIALLAGCRASLADVLADSRGVRALLERLADPARTVQPAVLALLYAQIATRRPDVDPPTGIRVGPERVVGPDHVAVLDQPWLLPAPPGVWLVLGGDDPEAVADLLDVPLLSELSA